MLRVLLIISISALVLCSCSGPDIEDPSDAFEIDPGPVDTSCCGVSNVLRISGTAPEGGQYYWAALFNFDTVVQQAEPVFIPEGPFENVELRLNISYLDNIPPGQYQLRAMSFESETDIGNPQKRALATEGALIEVPQFDMEQCNDCCTKTLRKYYARVVKDRREEGGVLGSRAEIKTRYGRLCGNVNAEAQSCAWVGIQGAFSSYAIVTYQFQAGYQIRRLPSGNTDTMVYVEFYPNDAYKNELVNLTLEYGIPFPAQSTNHFYSVEYDPETGDIIGKYDNYQYSANLYYFRDTILGYVSWTGEIDGRETDMPGTTGNKCEFKDCQFLYHDGQSWMNAYFGEQTDFIFVTPQYGDRPAEWGIWADTHGTTLRIWDIFPLED